MRHTTTTTIGGMPETVTIEERLQCVPWTREMGPKLWTRKEAPASVDDLEFYSLARNSVVDDSEPLWPEPEFCSRDCVALAHQLCMERAGLGIREKGAGR